MSEGKTSTTLTDGSVAVARERVSASAQAQPHNDFRAVDSAQDGPIPVADYRLASQLDAKPGSRETT